MAYKTYKAFISYSHANEIKLASAVQHALHRFAKPWNKLRALNVFRDKTSLSATPSLWGSIQEAISQSEYFILLASPEAAASPWVQKEVSFWLEHDSTDRILIIQVAGKIAWNASDNDFDWKQTTALPEMLKKKFSQEPLYVDLSWAKEKRHLSIRHPEFRDAIARFAATLHGKRLDEITGEDFRQQRKTKRLAWSAATTLFILLLASARLIWQVYDQHQREIALNKLNALRAELIRVSEWRRQPARNAENIRSALNQISKKLLEHNMEYPHQLQGFYVQATAKVHLGDFKAAEQTLESALAIDANFSPGWTLLARVKLEQFLITRYQADYGTRAIQHLDGKKDAVHFQIITPLDAAQSSKKDAMLTDAESTILRAASGNEIMNIEKWGLAKTHEDKVNEQIVRAMKAFYLEGDSQAAVSILAVAHTQEPSEEYCRLLGWLDNTIEARMKWLDESVFRAPVWDAPYLDRGDLRHKMGDFAGAIEDATKAIEIRPDLLPAYINRGNARYYQGDVDGAISDFSRAIEIAPGHANAYYLRGSALARISKNNRALEDLSLAVKIDPKFSYAYYVRGQVRLVTNDLDKAIDDFSTALATSAEFFPYAHFYRATAWKRKGEFNRAIEDYTSAIKTSPGYYLAYYDRGNLRREIGDYPGAIDDYTHAIEISPTYIEAYNNRGILRHSMKDYQKAIEDFTMAIKISPKSAMTYNNRGLAKQELGDMQGAIEDYNKSIRLDENFAMAYYNRGNVNVDEGDLDAAFEDFTKTIEIDPNYSAAYHNRGSIHERRGDLMAAIEDYSHAIAINPEYTLAYANRGMAYGMINEFERAIVDLNKAIELAPGDSFLYYNRAVTQHMAANIDKAITDYTRSIDLNPRFKMAYFNRAKILTVQGKIREAMADVEKTRELPSGGRPTQTEIDNLLELINRPRMDY